MQIVGEKWQCAEMVRTLHGPNLTSLAPGT